MHVHTLKSTLKFCSTILSIKCLIIIYNAELILWQSKLQVQTRLLCSAWLATLPHHILLDNWSVPSYTGSQGMMWRSSRTDEDELWCNAQFHTMSKPVVPVPPTRPCLGWWVWMVVTRHCHRHRSYYYRISDVMLPTLCWIQAAWKPHTRAVANTVAKVGDSSVQ